MSRTPFLYVARIVSISTGAGRGISRKYFRVGDEFALTVSVVSVARITMFSRFTPGRSIVTWIVWGPCITSVAGSPGPTASMRESGDPGPKLRGKGAPGGRGAKRSKRSRTRRNTSGSELDPVAPSSSSMGTSQAPRRALELLALAAAVLAALRAAGALAAFARLRGDHVVDPEDHHGGVRGAGDRLRADADRSEEHTSELQSPYDLVCRSLLEKNNC